MFCSPHFTDTPHKMTLQKTLQTVFKKHLDLLLHLRVVNQFIDYDHVLIWVLLAPVFLKKEVKWLEN